MVTNIGYRASWAGQKTTQLSGNLHGGGNPFLVVFRIYENAGSSREIFVVFGSATTVNEGSAYFIFSLISRG